MSRTPFPLSNQKAELYALGSALRTLFPLSNEEAEMCALGSALLNDEAAVEVLAFLSESDFYFPPHRMICKAMKSLVDKRTPLDLVTLKNELLRTGTLQDVGGEDYLIQVAEAVPSAANAMYYAEIVADKAQVRALNDAGQRICKVALSEDLTTEEKVQKTLEIVERAERNDKSSKLTSGTELMQHFVDRLNSMRLGEADRVSTTGFDDIDWVLGGFRPGCVYAIAAPQGGGKSAFMTCSAVNGARRGVKCLIISQEMPAKLLADRIVSVQSQINSRFLNGKISDGDCRQVMDGADRFYSFGGNIVIYDAGGIHVSELPGLIRAAKKMIGGLDVVWIDHFHLMRHKGATETEGQNATANKFIEIAKASDCAIVALAQMTKAGLVGNREEPKRPIKQDIRGGSGIIDAVTTLVFLYNRNQLLPRGHDDKDENPGRVELVEVIVDKNRIGQEGVVTLGFVPHLAEFRGMARV